MTTMTRFSEFFESKLNKLITSPTGPARRAMLFLCMFLICADNVWGKETIIWSGDAATEVSPLPSDKTELLKVGSTFRVYVSPFTQLYVARDYKSGSEPWVGVFSSSGNIDTNSEYAKESSYYEFVLTEDNIVLLKDDKLKISANGGGKISKITVETIDAFLNTPRSTCLPFSKPTEVAAGTETVVIEKPDDWPSIEAKYVRWYVANGEDVYDITGDDVSKPHLTLTTDLSFVTDEAHGSYWHSSSSEGASTLPFPTLKIPSGASIDEYQVIAVLSTEEGTTSGDDLTKEPAYDVVYTFTFEYPFKGDASSLTPITKEYTVTESKKTDVLTLAFDFSNSKIKLLDSSDNELGSQDMGGLWSSISSGGTLNSGQPFYVRWFLEKDGVETYIANAIQDAGTSYQTPAKERYGLYWQSNGGESLTDIMKIKLDGSKLPSDLTDYNLVCTIATDLTGEDTNAESKLSHEPSTMAMKYSISFKDAPWEGTLVSDPFSHSKEILVANESVTEVDIPLADEIAKIKKEFVESNFKDGLADHLHVRWYLTKKQDDGTYEKVPNSENYLSVPGGDYWKHQKQTDMGLYWNSDVSQKPSYDSDDSKILNIKVSKPSSGDSWEDYKLMILLTNDLTGQIVTAGKLEHEPDLLNMRYMYSFFIESAFQFVHSEGESGRDYHTQSDFTDAVQQYSWDNGTSTRKTTDEKIRQSVHTVEYNLYVDPSSTALVPLHMPFQNYGGTGDVLEPAAYIRWYDWMTDVNNVKLVKDDGGSSILENMEEQNKGETVSRGLFFLNNSKDAFIPTQSKIGVKFDPNGLSGLVTIACDVSKYYDGIYSSSVDDTRADFSGSKKPYLMHEPTLSIRYLFHIRPATDIADEIKAGKDNFDATSLDEKFCLAEDNGRVCIPFNPSKTTEFSVRASLPTLDDYFFYDTDGSTLVQGNKIKWVAYSIDPDGKVWENSTFNSVSSARIQHLTVSSFTGEYTNGSDTKTVNVGAGSDVHLVGYIYDSAETKSAPVVHYELNFINAPAYNITSLPLERTEEYLKQHMTLQATVNFDDYTGMGVSSSLDSQLNNHSATPLPWDHAQYGFCYPDVRRVYTSWGDGSGISPIHGDYMILKSINASGISENDATHIYKYHWYNSNHTVFDYTKTMGGGYGNFLYVDASDESRTIAKMNFKASLCAGSELCFTAAINDMTGGTGYIWPELMASVYAVKNNGKRVRVASFHSSDLKTVSDGTYDQGIWFQMYGKVTIPNNVDLTDLKEYEVEIDNYALGTSGADYCVDQLQFYTSTGKMKVEQTGGLCYGDDLSLTAYMTAELLENKIPTLSETPQKIYYRIFREKGLSGTQIQYEAYPDATVYDNGGKDYGEVSVCKAVLNAAGTALDNSTAEKTSQNAGYYFGTDGILYFKIADNKVFNLDQGHNYFFALTKNLPFDTTPPYTDTPTTALSDWANPNDPCDVFSNFFVPKKLTIDFKDGDSDASNVITVGCGSGIPGVTNYRIVLKYPDDTEASGFRVYANTDADDSKNIHFDYYIGKDESTTEFMAIFSAMRYFRIDYPTATSWPTFTESESNYSHYGSVLTDEVKAKIILARATSFSYSSFVAGTNYFLAMPIEIKTPDTHLDDICSPILFSFKVNGGGSKPELTLGFEDVTYPSDYTRVVRIGLEQIANAKVSGTHTLHIPVQSFKDNAGGTTGSIVFDGANLTLRAVYGETGSKTTDPTKTTANAVIATLQDDASAGRPTVNASHKYLAVKFDNDFTFHEGFQYELHTVYYDKTDDDGNAPATGACTDDLYLIIKVVPKYVTWRKENQTNRNWNNDDNWTRSVKDTLYSTTYKDNSATLGQPNTYTPMKFTYVTIPTGYGTQKTLAANLANLNQTSNITASGLYSSTKAGDDSSTATANIEYDMLVRWGTYTADLDGTTVAGDKCLGHGSISEGTSNIYDCEKFRGNVCREIYFKPQAELVNQQYLRYEKAWVEKELEPAKWYLMSAPLKDTYAGDMYVPYADGRQTTEAFQSISFGDGKGAYSRTKYPVYQRSWGKSAKVYVNKNDVRSDYAAQLGYTTVSSELAEWGHTYNDVTVPYSTLQGFSIRAHRKTQAKNTLIRLPKADTSYDYYNADFDDTSERVEPKDATKTVSKSELGRFVTDGTTDGTIDVTVADLQAQGTDDDMTYYLVGNPYMCSIDMGKFFDANTSLDKQYLTYEASTASTVDATATAGKIRPLQAFFVKSASTTPTIKFTKDMMIDGNFEAGSTATTNGARAAEAPALTLTATNGSTASKARVALSDRASAGYVASEDVETLFDSNLSDVPVVFTTAAMADAHQQRAVSIDVRPSVDVVPFGVACADSDEPVEVTIDYGQWTADGSLVYVIDAVTGESTEMGEGRAVTVQPNDYGRYFLSTRGDLTAIDPLEGTGGIVVSVRGHQVSVRAAEPLLSVRVLNAGGSLMSSVVPSGHEATISIDNGGVFVVEARTNSEIKAVKVMVRK